VAPCRSAQFHPPNRRRLWCCGNPTAGARGLGTGPSGLGASDEGSKHPWNEWIARAYNGWRPLQLGLKTWYGFPAYTWNDKLVAFFKPAAKFCAFLSK